MKCSRIDRLLMEQEHLSSLSRREIESLQLSRLNRLLQREKERGGFYQALPERIENIAGLSELPFTTDEDLARHAAFMLLTSQSRIQRVLSDATSGTTGTAKRVFYTERDIENTVRLYVAGLGELVEPGSVTMICFPFSGPYGLGELIAEAIARLGARPLKLGSSLCYRDYAEVMRQERPDTFVGMPAQLLSIFRVCGCGSLKRALVSGDACPEAVIHCCEELLSSRLFPHYGSREMGMAGAITCQAHAGMHLRENHIIAEIVDEDGSVLPPGEYGELVITTIGMEALPLIRYRTGDYTRILPGACPCGSEVLRLDCVHRKGRDGEMAALDNELFGIPAVADYRAAFIGEQLNIEMRTVASLSEEEVCACASKVFPKTDIRVRLSPVLPEHTALYPGKRNCLHLPMP